MSNRPFLGARIEEAANRGINARLADRGWVESVVPFIGYGTTEHIRVLARIVLRPAEATSQLGRAAEEFLGQRGWRNFVSTPVPRAEVAVRIGESIMQVRADRTGYVDVRVKNQVLEPGWHEVFIRCGQSEEVPVPIQVVSDSETFGLVSDIDDTIITTLLPRPLIAAWNTFVVAEQARQPVPGMAELYAELLARHPGAPTIYVSTGAWNTFPFLTRFMERNGYPRGALLLTDWGPTNTGWFRSGVDHKRRALRELARDFPQIRWVLFGDDGQHDPGLYGDFAELQPGHVRAIGIRQLSMAEQVLAHGTTTVLADTDEVEWTPESAPEVRGADGAALGAKLRRLLMADEQPSQ